MTRARADRMWQLWLLVGGLAGAAYFAIPSDHWASGLWYDGIGLASAVMIVVAVRRNRPARPAMWYWFAGGQALWVVGDLLYWHAEQVRHIEPFPSAADIFYLLAYPPLFVGLGLFVRGRVAGRDRGGLLDAAMLATGLGLLAWTLLMRPIVADSDLPTTALLISLAYPAADLVMLAMLARLLTGNGARTASFRLLTGALVAVLSADVAFSLVTTYSGYDGGPADAGWLASYVLWAAAALHPSVRATTPREDPDAAHRLSRGRLAVLGAVTLFAPALLIEQTLSDPGDVDWIAIGGGGVLMGLLVAARVTGLVAQIRLQADQLGTLAMHDHLTGLANRRHLETHLRQALLTGNPEQVHVALFDLDDFKAINDRLGHAIGDQVLVAVGDRIRAVVRQHDLVARLGGDEFAVVVTATVDECEILLNRILGQLRRPVVVDHHELLIQASIGLADGLDTRDPLEVVRRADTAMYAAKAQGRHRHLRYTPELDRRATEDAHLGARLRTALDTDRFQLVYQPIVALPTGRLSGVEALVRWRDPGHEAVSPATFIPVAERNGLVVELGTWVLREACRQLVAWDRRLGPNAPVKVSVNVSPRQLAEPGFADTVATVLAEVGLAPARLLLEVTETAVFAGGRSLDELRAIHDMGVQVALDDFGTGHSSLRLLQTCPVDVLKVDKTFVDGVTLPGQQSVIAAALITIADGLDLTAVAEGVETDEQANRLHALGYRFAQGFHFSRPLDPEGIVELQGGGIVAAPRTSGGPVPTLA